MNFRLLGEKDRISQVAMRGWHHSRRYLLRLHGDMRCRNQSPSVGARLVRCVLYWVDGGRGHHYSYTHSQRPICLGYFRRNRRVDPLPHLIDRVDSVRRILFKHKQTVLTFDADTPLYCLIA
jgi:hypothetical protein